MQVTISSSAQIIVPNAVALVKGWLQVVDADRLGAQVVQETFTRWVGQLKYGSRGRFFDRGHTMSRFGDPGVTYSFKGKPKPMFPMTPSLVALQKLVGSSLGWPPQLRGGQFLRSGLRPLPAPGLHLHPAARRESYDRGGFVRHFTHISPHSTRSRHQQVRQVAAGH